MIDYWNKDHFEGLKEVGEAYENRLGFELFGEYCLKKEQGLKKAANNAAESFINSVDAKALSTQREIIIHLCELVGNYQRVHSLTNHTIQMLIKRVLKVWIEDGSAPISAYHWYLLYCGYDEQREVLDRIFRIDPNDQVALQSEMSGYLRDLDWVTHHLNENILLLESSKTAHSILRQIELRLPKITDADQKTIYQTEFNYYEKLFLFWDEYQSTSQDMSFINWAKRHHGFEV